ncbi:hypothetical protein EF847_15720 [Actinobacteria bacterium YIM 96077]|uniref:Mandelate racemase/muconate lactonizing enzyme family protein n=1 Tax=Phytoactinopolyspora halophila TaxID=1981511 RepID=A0A329QCF5_9ACTN|nr:enolase C-terminal domain-like protein [Phytoactinopolyspora halophila]AYY13931.1 hypothetical protein EF847_15720 [Actinobacteria bacterium YIM 96077]RAW10060.1 hypothetical protein DPM12_19540 [Phytoactinopolyspora halophila]
MTSSDFPAIERIDVAEARFALIEPVTMGGRTVTDRDYTFVRIITDSGTHGCSYGITRLLPVASAIERIVAPQYLDEDIGAPADTYHRVSGKLGILSDDSCVRRGLSLLDIAMWDACGSHVGRPVSELIGPGDGSSPTLMSVDGYLPATGETAHIRRSVESTLEAGIRTVKFAYLDDPDAMRRMIDDVAPEARDADLSVVVDMIWTLRSVDAGRAVSRSLDGLNVEWIEDPYPGQMLRDGDLAHEAFDTTIAFGDEATDPCVLRDLATLGRTDIVRVDATTIGGLTGAAAVIRQAHDRSYPVGCHIYPEIHQHLAHSAAGAEYVEIFPADGRFDAADRFRTTTVDISAGTIAPPAEPGLGLGLDWDAIARASTSFHTVEGSRHGD